MRILEYKGITPHFVVVQSTSSILRMSEHWSSPGPTKTEEARDSSPNPTYGVAIGLLPLSLLASLSLAQEE